MSENQNPSGRYPHVLKAVTEAPWAIDPPVLATIRELVVLRASGQRFTEEEIHARIGAGPARRELQMAGSIAVIPIHGVLTPRADLFTAMSGGTSVQRLQATIADAVSDKKVSAIVFDVSSPGGMIDLIPELASEIRAARGKKPIVAVSNTKAASAAYWLASQADEIVASPSAMQGSIGVFAAHEDISGMEEKLGIKTTLVSAGKFKTEGNPFEPLSDEAKAAIQKRIDEMYGMFTLDVAKGRRVPVSDVRSGFGEGRMLTAKDALKAGMIDGIETLQSVVDRLANGGAKVPEPPEPEGIEEILDDPESSAVSEAARSGLSFADETAALHDRARALVDRTTSLAEVERGHLTVAKRERLTACTGALRETVAALDQVLAATDPDKQRDQAAGEFARLLARTAAGGVR
ncbi:MAG: S49 family peptidase [Actinomycetota bacterium]|nr:S49 family peptidase [Actinomycetota bacterium]